MKFARLPIFLLAQIGWQAAAQGPAFDASGNSLLNGTYYFRQVAYVLSDSVGDIGQEFAAYGNISFDGNGKYSITATEFDSNNGVQQPFNVTGTYTISASGFGFLDNPLSNSDRVYGLVSNGTFVGSSTENTASFNDLFIAAPMPSSSTATAAFQGSYTIAYMVPGASPTSSADVLFQLNPDGRGNLGTVNLTGYIGGQGSSTFTQSSSKVRYIISSGAANVIFPTSSSATLIAGNEYLYLTPDGSFVFGGSPTGFDMFVGVKSTPASADFEGLYYNAGLDQDTSQLANGFATLAAYYGSLSASSGKVVGHQRILASGSSDYTYSDSYSFSPDGTYDDAISSTHYVLGDGGAVRIGLGIGPFLGISVAFRAPKLSGPGVFVSPQGVVNAASSAPFTAAIAPGELITLYGTNLAPETQVASTLPFPTKLAGVQVLINQIPAPVYVVSPGQVSAVVPYATTLSIAQVQVINNGVASNVVTEFVGKTAPGVFTSPPGGLGLGAVLHANYTLVTTSHPAQPGETVSVYLTGLGAVFPPIQDGAAGPVSPLSKATNTIAAYIDGVAATVTYSGLAPQLAGLYQVNLTVPSGVSAGNSFLDISGPDSYTSESLIPIGSGMAAGMAESPGGQAHRDRRATSGKGR